MRLPLDWLRRHLQFDCSISEITDRLTSIGFEVERVDCTLEPASNEWQPGGSDQPNVTGDARVIEIAVTPNRGDALSIRGVARELAASGIGRLTKSVYPLVPGSFASPIEIQIEDAPSCRWISGRVVRDVRNSPSPPWMQRLLTLSGLRPVNCVVDVLNYVMLDVGQPLHAYDTDTLQPGPLTVRRGNGEQMSGLDGESYPITPDDVVVSDSLSVRSIAGILGSSCSSVSEATTSVFLEAAIFDPVSIALTGRRHQIGSEARRRFERGIDPAEVSVALEMATGLLLELNGGEASTVSIAGSNPYPRRSATMRFSRIASLGGLDVEPDHAVGILERLGFTVTSRDAVKVTVAVPTWRNDIAGPAELDQFVGLHAGRALEAATAEEASSQEADLVEEVLRISGIEKIPAVSIPTVTATPQASLSSKQLMTAIARRTLASRGLMECVTFSFMAQDQARMFGESPTSMQVLNPISGDLDQLRPTPVATLALAAQRNIARGALSGALFEVGPAFPNGHQRYVLAGLRFGPTSRDWANPAAPLDIFSVKADVMAVLAALRFTADDLTVVPDGQGFYHPGRSGQLMMKSDVVLATFGAVHPSVLRAASLEGPMVGFEIYLDALSRFPRSPRAQPKLPRLQPVRRDFAFIVDLALPVGAILDAIRSVQSPLIDTLSVFDVYSGSKIPFGKKSVGIEVGIQPDTASLRDVELDGICKSIVDAVVAASGASLRG